MSSPETGAGPWPPRPPGSGELPLLELQFRPGPLVPPGTLWIVVVLALLIGSSDDLLTRYLPIDGRLLEWTLGIAGFALIAFSLALRSRTRSGPVASLRAYSDHLILPRSAGSRRTYDLPYRDVYTLELLGSADQPKLVIGTRRYLLLYPLSALHQPELVGELRMLVRERLGARGDGERLLTEMDERESFGRALRVRASRVTNALCLAIGAIYVLEELTGALRTPFGLLRLGANAPALVRDGQIYRLFSANFLHGGLLHAFMNVLGLWMLGMALERLLGPWRFALVYLVSGVAGAIGSVLFTRGLLSVGASAAVFGLLGAMAMIQWRHGANLPTGFRQPVRWWVFILSLNGFLPLLVPQIDIAAHAAGFIAGGILGALVVPSFAVIRRASASRGLRVATVAVVVAYGLALGQAALASLSPLDDDRARVLESLLDEPAAETASTLNMLAWFSAIDPSSSKDELAFAQRAAARGRELVPDALEIQDTLATVEYRLGHFERAAELERDVFQQAPNRTYGSQLARFLAARAREKGLWIRGRAGALRGATLTLIDDKGPSSERQLRLTLEGDATRGAELWFVERAGKQLDGYGVLRLGPGGASERLLPADLPVTKSLEDFRLELVSIDGDACGECAPGSLTWKYQALDPEIRELP
jgi:rhomboid protease GluP